MAVKGRSTNLLVTSVMTLLVSIHTVAGQSETLTAVSTVQYLASPNYPNPYPSDSDYQWHITSSNVVVLEIQSLNLDGTSFNCNSDYVKIYDGSNTYSPQIQVLCGDMFDGTFESTGIHMTVVFRSVGVNSINTGFRFSYRSKTTLPSDWGYPDITYKPMVVPSDISYTFSDTGYSKTYIGVGTAVPLCLLSVCLFICRICIIRRRTVTRTTMLNVRRTPVYLIADNANTQRETPSQAGMQEPQITPDPPAYPGLNSDLPPYTASAPAYSAHDRLRHDFPNQSGWTAQNEPAPLLNGQKDDPIKGMTNLAYSDETGRDRVKDDDVYVNVNSARGAQ